VIRDVRVHIMDNGGLAGDPRASLPSCLELGLPW
jgi:hypothetical protein